MRSAPLCLLLLALGAFGCREDAPEAAATAGASVPDWATRLCEDWVRSDGTCDLGVLVADYEECQRTQGAPEVQRLAKRGVRTRARIRAGERKTNLCLELRKWRMTQAKIDRWRGRSAPAPPPS
jgi:hypothetical protein